MLGGTLAYMRDPLTFMQGHSARYGPVSEMDFVGARWTVLLGPDACGEALRNAARRSRTGPAGGASSARSSTVA